MKNNRKIIFIILIMIFFVGGVVALWPNSKFWNPLAACGQLVSAAAIFAFFTQALSQAKQESFTDMKEILSWIGEIDSNFIIVYKKATIIAEGPGVIDYSTPLGAEFGNMIIALMKSIVRFSVLLDSGVVDIELFTKYPHLYNVFTNAYNEITKNHESWGATLPPGWDVVDRVMRRLN